MSVGFRERVLRGSAWNVTASLTGFAFDLVVGVILARLLTPADFGLVAMAMVAARFVAVLGSIGLGPALVQRETIDAPHVSTAFWVALLINGAVALLIAISAPAVSGFYEEPRLTAITRVIAIEFPIATLSIIPRVMLQREVRFSAIAKVQLIASFVGGTAAVLLAFLGAGVWCIALRGIVEQSVSAAIYSRLAPYRPSLHLGGRELRNLLGFGGSYYLDQLVKFASRNLDTVVIGRFLGSNPLGLYSRAYGLMMLPLSTVAQALFNVFFAAFSAVQNDDARIARIHLKVTGALAVVFAPTMLGLMTVAEPAVLVVFGEDWRGMVDVVRILSPAGALHGVFGIYSPLYMSKGRTDLQLRYTLIGRTVVLVGIVGGLPWGIAGVAFGYSVGTVVDVLLNSLVAGRLVGVTLGAQLRAAGGVFLAAGVMAVAVFAADRLWVGGWSAVPRLGVLVLLGAAVYSLQMVTVRPVPYVALMDVVVSRFRRRGAGEGSG